LRYYFLIRDQFFAKQFSYDFPKIRNLPKIFIRRFENVAPVSANVGIAQTVRQRVPNQQTSHWESSSAKHTQRVLQY